MMVAFHDVSKIFPDGTVALRGVSLEIPRGAFTVLLGASGAGKSTLLYLVNGMTRASAGAVDVEGVRIGPRTLRHVQRTVSMIHQQFQLVDRLSVLDNVLSGALRDISTGRALIKWFTAEQRRRACELIEMVGLGPEHVYRRASDLSGGQQQRVAIARAFISMPRIVLADEPVSSLDPGTSEEILTLLKDTARQFGVTVLCSLHQVDLALEFADHIIGMRQGRLEFEGPAHEKREALARLYDKAEQEHCETLIQQH